MKMKYLISLLGLVLLTSCLAPEDPQVSHRPLEIKNVDTLEANVPIETNPSTFTMFYWPEELDWESPLYDVSSSYETKLTALMTEIRVLSGKIDRLDEEVYNFSRTPEVKDCLNDPETHHNCEDLLTQYMDLAQTNLEKKAQILGLIKTHLDQPERDGTPNQNPENWIKLGEREDSLFRLEGNRKLILLKKFGNEELSYSSNNPGEVEDWRVSTNSMGMQTLHFTLNEKNQRGDQTGLRHEFKLERSRFLNYVRYFGKVFLKDESGRVLRAGMAKLDFAVK